MDRIEKLFALVLVAFTWAYKAGIYLDSLCTIKTKIMAESQSAYSNTD